MHRTSTTGIDSISERTASRRNLLRLGGGAVAAGAATSLFTSGGAQAYTGSFQFGAQNNAGGDITELTSIASTTLKVSTGAPGGSAVTGTSSGGGNGVVGVVQSPQAAGYGVWGKSEGLLGYGVVAWGGQAQLLLYSGGAGRGPSAAAPHLEGEIAYDSETDAFWACVGSGNPGTWRKLASMSTAGAFHPISPSRVYDSRKPSSNPLATGQNRTVSVADRINVATGAVVATDVVPAGATAISYNVTVANTVGTNGYLSINEGGNAVVAASIINWSAPALTLANSSVVKLDNSRQITVICGGTSTSTNFIIDVLGYYV